MFVLPNPINFSRVVSGFEEAFETGNVVVLFTILVLLLLYAVLAVWAWRNDKKDFMQVRKGPFCFLLPIVSSNFYF